MSDEQLGTLVTIVVYAVLAAIVITAVVLAERK